jgi:hypothetical protein
MRFSLRSFRPSAAFDSFLGLLDIKLGEYEMISLSSFGGV